MNKDKITTLVIAAALCGGVVKMVKALIDHGSQESIDEKPEVIEE